MEKRLFLTTILCSALLLARGDNAAVPSATQKLDHECAHQCDSVDPKKDPFAGLDPIQQRLLSNLMQQHERPEYPVAFCFAPDTPPEVIAKRYAEMELVDSFRIHPQASRWTSTATDGSNIPRGVPITIRWSFLPDGTAIPGSASVGDPAAPSNLIAFMNGIYGSQAVWQPLFKQVFDRWSELCGLTYVYEPNDDGAAFSSSPGVVGVRGDVRIGGHYIDGNSNVLAYNSYPVNGDMVIDTGDSFFSTTSNNSLRLRNVLSHEAGHGLGFQHVCPIAQTKLMEPFVSVSFDGPQHDDILAAHRNYGDNYGVIDSTANAANLGLLTNQTVIITNLSIDGTAEVDFFKFSLDGSSKWATVTVTPIGSSYLEGAQNGDGTCSGGTMTNSLTRTDLSLQLLDVNGTTILASANAQGVGGTEAFTNAVLASAGPYYVRIAASGVDDVQLYQLRINIANAALPAPVIVAEPATTPGTQNTIFWNALGARGFRPTEQPVSSVASLGHSDAATEENIQPVEVSLPEEMSIIEDLPSGEEDPSPVWQGIFSSMFEGSFGSGWSRSGNPSWGHTTFTAHTGTGSAWCAGSAGASAASGYVNNMNSWMIYGPFSLADSVSARVTYSRKMHTESNADFFKYLASTNGINFSGFQTSGDFNTWSSRTYDLANASSVLGNLNGKSQVWIAFVFSSNDTNSGPEGYSGVFLDNIVIEKDVPALADLTPYQPAGWTNKIALGTSPLGVDDPHSYDGVFYNNQTLYLNWASMNQGETGAGSYTVRAEVSGTGGGTWDWIIPTNEVSEWYGLDQDQPVGPLSAGTHTLKLWVDYHNNISENNEANNYYERTITVSTQLPFEYYAEAATTAGFASPVNSGWISGTQHTFINLTPGQTYWYRVKARQGANETPWSASVSSQQALNPVLAVGPASHDFGSILVGGTASRTFSVTNTGTGTLSGSASVSAPFSIFSGGSYNLTAGQSQSVVVRYNPVASGTNIANVVFTGGAGSTNQVSGSATLPVITVGPNSHSFGPISVGETADRTFSVTNTGTGTLSGSASASAPFSILSGGSYSLTAGQSQAVVVRYSPGTPGTNVSAVVFTGGLNKTNQVTGIATLAVLSVGPANQNFGSIVVGGTADRTFSVTNTGTGTLSGSASVSAPFSIFSGGSYNLAAGQSQNVVVRYSPVTSGTNIANVIFTGGLGATNQVSGLATLPVIAVGPASQNFGTIAVGATVDRTFSVTNTGTGTLSGSASVPAPFSVFSGGSYNLTAGQSQSVIVRYNPVSPGTNSASVVFTGGLGFTNQVSGIATNTNTAPIVTITLPTTGTNFVTNTNTIGLSGSATDNLGVTSVTWSNSRGGSGTAIGTTNWNVSSISLQPGTNVLTVTAQDASSATGTDTLNVVFIRPNVFHSFGITNGNFRFTLDGEVGRTYVVQHSSDLISWPVLVYLTNTTGSVTYTDLAATNRARVYRAFPQ